MCSYFGVGGFFRTGSCMPKYGLSCATSCIKIDYFTAYEFQSVNYGPGHKLWLLDSSVWVEARVATLLAAKNATFSKKP
jgi:hypothetical protein